MQIQEDNNQDKFTPGRGTPPEIELPFGKRETDPGEWAFDRRAALSITVIIYLVLAIVFVSSKLIINNNDVRSSEIVVTFDDLDKLQEELQRAEELNRRLMEDAGTDYEEVYNRISNEAAVNTADPRDHFSQGTAEIYDRSDEVIDRMHETRDLYEQGLREQETAHAPTEDNNTSSGEDVRVQGNVTVSFSFRDPVRSSIKLLVPAYRCQAGGRVVVNVTVDQTGTVLAAVVDKALSSSDHCMTTTAVEASLSSRFGASQWAPKKHQGTITYVFVPQG